MKKPIDAIINEVVIQPEKIQPIIVNFQNGQLKDEETKKMKCGLYQDEKKKKTVLAMSNGQVVYKGYRPDLDKELTYTMLAIHNKKTGKVRLIQAERWDVAPVLDEHIDNSHDDVADKVGALNKQFGSKKVKRRTEQYERMRINVDSVKEQLEKTVAGVEIHRNELEPVAIDSFTEGLHLPPCNRDASHESLIYDVYDIVPKNILETLYEQVPIEIESEPEKDTSKFYVETLKKLKSDGNNELKVALLLYIKSVINYLHVPSKNLRKHVLEVCPYSSEVNIHVNNNYSVASTTGRLRPTTMRDKGVIHCILLGLTIWNYKLDLELFSTLFQLRLSTKKLQDLARWIGAVPDKHDKKYVILKLPLPAQQPKILTKKKK